MKPLIASIICLLFTTMPAHSQDMNIPDISGYRSIPLHLMGPYGPYYQQEEKNVEGSPFLFDGVWVTGKIIKPSGHPTQTLEFRYDKNREELEVKIRDSGQEKVLLVPNRNVKGFIVTGKQAMEFRNGFSSEDGDINRYTLLQVIYDGESKLLKYHKSKYIEGRQPDFRTGLLTDKFVDNERYYLTDESGSLHAVKLRKRAILEQLSSSRKKVEQYAEENDLSFKDESELVLILKYFEDHLR